jgi:hypothetical protein
MSPLNLFFDNGVRDFVPPGTIATRGSPQDNPQAGTTYTNSFGSPGAVQPVPRIRRVRRSLNDFQDQLESLDFRMPMASAADKVGPMRVSAGGAAPTVCLWVGLGKPVGKEKHAGGQLVTMREIH